MDLYVESDEARGKIPAELVAELEPTFRHIQETPHQMGGKRFEVQNTAMRFGHIMLFQVGSDTKLGWSWGDAGALYFSINPLNLALRRFHRVHGWLEGH